MLNLQNFYIHVHVKYMYMYMYMYMYVFTKQGRPEDTLWYYWLTCHPPIQTSLDLGLYKKWWSYIRWFTCLPSKVLGRKEKAVMHVFFCLILRPSFFFFASREIRDTSYTWGPNFPYTKYGG